MRIQCFHKGLQFWNVQKWSWFCPLINIRYLGPHFCCWGSPLGPHFTRNWVPMKDILGPHTNWEQCLLRVCTEDCEFRKYFLSLKSNAGSVCKKTRIFVNQNSWFLLATLCFWSLGFTFLFTIFELELLIDENHRAKINIISDIEKLLKWLPVV